MGKFFNELKRRNVVRVGLAYVVVGWLVFQIGEVLFPVFGTPDWVFKTIILVIAIGLPFALIFAWAFELTTDGVKKTRDVNIAASVTASTGRKLDFIIIGALIIALGYFVIERQPVIEQIVEEGPEAAEPDEPSTGEVAEQKKKSIAVIPFVNMSSDQDQEWFADGLTEEILNSLARTPDLLVAARTSSFVYKGSNDDVPTIAKALGVEHVLEGSVRRSGERLRVTAQLIRASDGFHLWSETFDRTMDDMIDIQENVAIEIANALETAMDPEALALMVSSGTSSVPAYEAYLQGLAYGVSQFATGDIYEGLGARDAFERAIELDPEFSSAYWRLANFWYIQSTATNIVAGITGLSPAEMDPLFKGALNNAIQYENDSVSEIRYRTLEAYASQKYRQSLRLNKEYLEHRPNDQQAQTLQIIVLNELGLQDQVAETIEEVYERDGYDVIFAINALTVLRAPKYHDALHELAKHAVRRFSDNISTLYQAHRAFLWVGDIDNAASLLATIQASDFPKDVRYLAALRQACSENRVDDAERLHARGNEEFATEVSIIWLGHKIMGNELEAIDTLMPLDEANDMLWISDFLSYAAFDPKPFPNLMALMASQDIERNEIFELPYRCGR